MGAIGAVSSRVEIGAQDRLAEVGGPHGVDLERARGVVPGSGHRRRRRQVVDHVRTGGGEQGRDRLRPNEITFDQVDARSGCLESGPVVLAPGETPELDVGVVGPQLCEQVGGDEAGDAGDQDAHAASR
jgi:hypothetical protein